MPITCQRVPTLDVRTVLLFKCPQPKSSVRLGGLTQRAPSAELRTGLSVEPDSIFPELDYSQALGIKGCTLMGLLASSGLVVRYKKGIFDVCWTENHLNRFFSGLFVRIRDDIFGASAGD